MPTSAAATEPTAPEINENEFEDDSDDENDDGDYNVIDADGTDTDIMELILAKIVFPEMIEFRRQCMANLVSPISSQLPGAATSVAPDWQRRAAVPVDLDIDEIRPMQISIEDYYPERFAVQPVVVTAPVELPRMVMCLDGDYPQIQAILIRLRPALNAANIEIWKSSGGCSMSQAANDLMKGHREFRRCLSSTDYYKPLTYTPRYVKDLETFLTSTSKMSAASRATYLHFFARVDAIESKVFTRECVNYGWRTAGILPFSIVQILSQCSSYREMNGAEQDLVVERTKLIAASHRSNGRISDEDMLEYLADLGVTTTIQNMETRVLIQQRSLWLTRQDVTDFRMAREARILAAARDKQEAATIKAAAKAKQVRVDQLRLEARENSVKDGNAHVPIVDCWCSNPACSTKYLSTCTTCRECSLCQAKFVVCGAKTCLTSLNSHQKVCAQRREPMD